MSLRHDTYISVYMTAPDQREAATIAKALVKDGLAACVTIIPKANSYYRWKGKIKKDQESIILAKTKANLFRLLTKRVTALHSYECPCILAMPIEDGASPYLAWLETETQKGGKRP